MSLARRIRDYRYAKGWGPDELANRAKISRTALYQIECGKTETPRAGTLNRIARALGVDIEMLMGGSMAAWDGATEDGKLEAEAAAGRKFLDIQPVAPPALMTLTTTISTSRQQELELKFRELLQSPLGDGLVRLVEATYRLLPSAAERTAV